jgi:hypothetical protein
MFWVEKEEVIQSGDGPIHAISWNDDFIAFATDIGIKVYCVSQQKALSYIDRPLHSPHPQEFK